MKVSGLFIAFAVSAQAFSPSANDNARVGTALNAKDDRSIFRRISDLDLFAPKSTQNDYGARNTKNVKVGELSKRSYVPSGLTKAQYDKFRKNEQKKRAANYKKNVAKAGVFIDYTDWYKARGTDTNQDWAKSVTAGHRMAKTKYDWQGDEQTKFSDSGAGKDKKKKKKSGMFRF